MLTGIHNGIVYKGSIKDDNCDLRNFSAMFRICQSITQSFRSRFFFFAVRTVATCTPIRTGVHIIIKRVSALDNLTSGTRLECTILHVEMQNWRGGEGILQTPGPRWHIIVRRTH